MNLNQQRFSTFIVLLQVWFDWKWVKFDIINVHSSIWLWRKLVWTRRLQNIEFIDLCAFIYCTQYDFIKLKRWRYNFLTIVWNFYTIWKWQCTTQNKFTYILINKLFKCYFSLSRESYKIMRPFQNWNFAHSLILNYLWINDLKYYIIVNLSIKTVSEKYSGNSLFFPFQSWYFVTFRKKHILFWRHGKDFIIISEY